MREILFKAKTIDGKRWVEGYYFAKPILDKHFVICDEAQWEIDINTLCQYTGLTDKNGNKIWENDLLECKSKNNARLNRHFLSQVEWDEESTGFAFHDSTWGCAFMDSISEGGIYECEVIGNIFDNPELMKG